MFIMKKVAQTEHRHIFYAMTYANINSMQFVLLNFVIINKKF